MDEPSVPTRRRRGAQWRGVLAGLVITAAIVAVPLLSGGGHSQSGGGPAADEDEALVAVRAAVGRTVASGSYETAFETSSTHPIGPGPQPCSPRASCTVADPTSTFESRGHGVVNFDPYVSRVVTETSVGPRVLVVTSTTVWLTTGDNGGTIAPGIPLSQFASQVQATLGPSQGALAMISLASPGGSLNLEEAAVADATPAGTGTVEGTSVTYYDVTIDMTKLAETPELTDVQRATIEAALPLLHQGGYTGTTERIAVDAAGMIREVTATTHFADGSTGTRHTILSSFGCAPTVHPPDQQPPAEPTPTPCQVAGATSTTVAPTSRSTTSSAVPTTTAALSVPATSSPAADASDLEEIRAAFLGWIDAQPKDAVDAYVEDYASIRDAHRMGIAQHSPETLARYSGRVDSITLIDESRAEVVYSILYDGIPRYDERRGQAVKLGGTWMVSRDTVCALLALGGIACPPPTTITTTPD